MKKTENLFDNPPYLNNSSYVVSRQSLIPRSCAPVICWMPLSILTRDSLVISMFFSCIIRTSSVCPISLSRRILRMLPPISMPVCFIFCSIRHPFMVDPIHAHAFKISRDTVSYCVRYRLFLLRYLLVSTTEPPRAVVFVLVNQI